MSTASPLLLVGAGGHARACIDVIEQQGRYSIVGLLGVGAEAGASVSGYRVVGTDSDLPLASDSSYSHTLVVVGQIKTPEPRMRLFARLEEHGYTLATVISPRAYVSPHATVGAGTIVMHGAVVNAGARIGRNCIINSQALVEHDAVVADHCHVATAATINSGVSVGAGSFIGSGSVVRQGITIGERCVIGMGARVLADCDAGVLFVMRQS